MANLERKAESIKLEEAPESTRVGIGKSQKPGNWIFIINKSEE